jgi:hypothetical protein
VEVPVEAPVPEDVGLVPVVAPGAPGDVVVVDLIVVLEPAAPLAAGAALVPEPPLPDWMVVLVLLPLRERVLVPDRMVVLTPVRTLDRSRTTISGRLRSMITARLQPRPQRCPCRCRCG